MTGKPAHDREELEMDLGRLRNGNTLEVRSDMEDDDQPPSSWDLRWDMPRSMGWWTKERR